MIYEKIPVETYCPAVHAAIPQSAAELVSYARPASGCLAERDGRWGVIVVPGGGYRMLAPSESEPVALAFLSRGCQTFVLRYSLIPAKYPAQLLELAGAVAHLRQHREAYGLSHIAVCGLSAGGHLTGCLCNLWADPMLSGTLQAEAELFRPRRVAGIRPRRALDGAGGRVAGRRGAGIQQTFAGLRSSLP